MKTKTILINLKTVDELYNEFFMDSFREAIKKVVASKAVIRMEVGENKKVFTIICNNGETIYINRNTESVCTVSVCKFYRSTRKDYKNTSIGVIVRVRSIYKKWLNEVK